MNEMFFLRRTAMITGEQWKESQSEKEKAKDGEEGERKTDQRERMRYKQVETA